MKVYAYDLQSDSTDQMSTELRYVIATARAGGDELIRINVLMENADRAGAALLKLLKSLKREGKIDFFADRSAFESGSREASYLINKFSDITEFCKSESFYLVIKL